MVEITDILVPAVMVAGWLIERGVSQSALRERVRAIEVRMEVMPSIRQYSETTSDGWMAINRRING